MLEGRDAAPTPWGCLKIITVRSLVIWSTFFFQTFRGSLAAVSTPIFASKASFFSIFRALHFLLCTSPEFCDFSLPLHSFFAEKDRKTEKKVDQMTTDLRVVTEVVATGRTWHSDDGAVDLGMCGGQRGEMTSEMLR